MFNSLKFLCFIENDNIFCNIFRFRYFESRELFVSRPLLNVIKIIASQSRLADP